MAVLKGPLFSLGAAQQLGKALVYFNWKGLNVVREYVIPANPQTGPQTTQRGYLTAAVAAIHEAQAEVSDPLNEGDVYAYALWASVVQAATTWFNQAVRHWIDRLVLNKKALICRGGNFSAVTATGFRLDILSTQFGASPKCATGKFKYGTSKTALINTKAAEADLAFNHFFATWTGLASKTKYFIQFEGKTHADYLGAKSGIYHVTTT